MMKTTKIKQLPDLYLTNGRRHELGMSVKEYAVLREAGINVFSHADLIKSLRAIRAFSAKDRVRETTLSAVSRDALSVFNRRKLEGLIKKRKIIERIVERLEDILRQVLAEVQEGMKELKVKPIKR
jgi:hypothetical protein